MSTRINGIEFDLAEIENRTVILLSFGFGFFKTSVRTVELYAVYLLYVVLGL